MEVLRLATQEEATNRAAASLEGLLAERAGKPTLLLLSGGSSLKLLEHLKCDMLGDWLTVTVLDDRYSTDPEINNFSQVLASSFGSTLETESVHLIDTRPRLWETLEGAGERFDTALKLWRDNNPDGLVLATIGLGADGHVAGMMPYPEDYDKFKELFCSDKWALGYDAGEKNPISKRVTTTITFLRDNLYAAVSYAIGSAKQDVLNRVLADQGQLADTPARFLRELRKVIIFTDIK